MGKERLAKIREEVRKYGSLFYCHQITSHSEMLLYSLIIHFTSLFFHIVTFSVDALIQAGNPFLKTLSIEGGIMTTQPCLHPMLGIVGSGNGQGPWPEPETGPMMSSMRCKHGCGQDPTFYRQGFEKRISCLDKCINREGDYVEKQ